MTTLAIVAVAIADPQVPYSADLNLSSQASSLKLPAFQMSNWGSTTDNQLPSPVVKQPLGQTQILRTIPSLLEAKFIAAGTAVTEETAADSQAEPMAVKLNEMSSTAWPSLQTD
ncbi:hypothetical protein [Halomicronema hongdechloris]|uniref:hypothetical protein n=1 Tax=Halomicronema hongdechloris TaxID=1209493 RepID=UPI0010CC8D70|nr:hypothetical protein [Halomicronema hongdechloris]